MFAVKPIILLLILIASVGGIALKAEAEAGPAALELDQLSSECLSCHEDIDEPKKRFHGGHITGRPYEDDIEAGQKFRRVSFLPPELVLVEGKITCATCHGLDPHDGQILVIDNRGSALCNSCHNL